jgi:phosphatidylserine/phosphatidylglycerophosphate/cardiolipin synthase-like enzyme
MIDQLLSLSERDLQETAIALRSGRIAPPFSPISMQRTVSKDIAELAANAFNHLASQGFNAAQIATVLDVLRGDRVNRPRLEDSFQLVTTGPEINGVTNRDTGVVVRELFANATESVLVAGYAIYQGQRVFQSLADRMIEFPNLRVQFFLDIQRPQGDTSTSQEIIGRFADRFQQAQWPQHRPLPEVYFDPRSLEISSDKRACLHAKTVVVDCQHAFVSSANFTEAAHYRNIEVGILVHSRSLSLQLTEFFHKSVAVANLQPISFRKGPSNSITSK